MTDASPQTRVPETSQMRRLLSLGVHTLGTSFDVGLLVVGTALVGLAIAVLLDGFGVVEIGLSESTGSMLGSGLVIAVFGAFALGVAVEGPIGYSTRRRGTFSDIEVAIAGGVGALLAGLILFLVANYVRRFVEDLPVAFDFGVTIIRSAGRAGMTFGLFLGVPALWGVRELWGHNSWIEEIELPIFYAIWATAAAFFIAGAI
ncbi:MAG: hypothetical protein OEX97_06705 [Acidimicrobiia bacterium]|nr:hypothetical protein [Acidimicrobiia bacterium]